MTVSSLQGLNLQKRYRDKVAVDDVSVAVERGEVIGSVSYTHLTLPTKA